MGFLLLRPFQLSTVLKQQFPFWAKQVRSPVHASHRKPERHLGKTLPTTASASSSVLSHTGNWQTVSNCFILADAGSACCAGRNGETVTDMLLFVDAGAMPQHHQYAALSRMDEVITAGVILNDSRPKPQGPSPEPSRSPNTAPMPLPQHGA